MATAGHSAPLANAHRPQLWPLSGPTRTCWEKASYGQWLVGHFCLAEGWGQSPMEVGPQLMESGKVAIGANWLIL